MGKKNATLAPGSAYGRPSFEGIPVDCEITSYAPDQDGPLF